MNKLNDDVQLYLEILDKVDQNKLTFVSYKNICIETVQQIENVWDIFQKKINIIHNKIKQDSSNITNLYNDIKHYEKSIEIIENIEYLYTLPEEFRNLILKSPNYEWDEIIGKLNDIGSAIEFYTDCDPESSNLPILRALFQNGSEIIQVQFKKLMESYLKIVEENFLKDYSDHVIKILVALTENNELHRFSLDITESFLFANISENDDKILTTIMEWLINNSKADYISLHQQYRTLLIHQSVKKFHHTIKGSVKHQDTSKNFRDRRKTRCSFKSIEGIDSLNEISSKVSVNDPGSILMRKINVNIGLVGLIIVLIEIESIYNTKFKLPDFSHTINNYIFQLIMKIIDNKNTKISNFVNNLESKNFHIIGCCVKYLINLMKIYLYVNQYMKYLKNLNTEVLENSLRDIQETTYTAMLKYSETIEIDKETNNHIPDNASVHEITTYVSNFVIDILDNRRTIEAIMVNLNEDKRNSLISNNNFKDNTHAAYLFSNNLLLNLFGNIEMKSRAYSQNITTYIFLFNNYSYIERIILRYELNKCKHFVNSYGLITSSLKFIMEKYIECWNSCKMDNSLSTENLQMKNLKPSKKQCQMIKKIFKIFNESITSLIDAHKNLCIPSSNQLFNDTINEYFNNSFIPYYDSIIQSYGHLNFSKKIPKYIIYNKESLNLTIKSIMNEF